MNSISGYWSRLRNFWFPAWASLYWLLLALPALYFFQTLVHEGSHALTAFFKSGEFPKLAAFPHMTPDGRFLNGVAFGQADAFIATPQFVDLALIVGLALIFIFWPIQNHVARFLLRLWFVGACIDLLYNTARELVGGHNRFADWSRFQDDFAIGSAGMIILTWVMWLIVFSHFGWVYASAWGRYRENPSTFWSYRWPAFVLGLLSLWAILMSIFVSDPRIVKGSAAFIVPFIVQILALIWYGTYFVLSFRRSD